MRKIDLSEYSQKYGISVSTLRRRIKNGEIEYALNDGKYYLLDQAPAAQPSPLPTMKNTEARVVAPPQKVSHSSGPPPAASSPVAAKTTAKAQEKTATSAAGRIADTSSASDVKLLLAELKSTYAMVLQEKEEQIIMLKQEIADLRTLAKVLEDSLTKKKSRPSEASGWNDVLSADLEV
jgi:DNA invertase Pin-like site-specific DNA recombinase